MLKSWKERWDRFWKDEEGIGTLEILLIIALILVVAVAFRKWIIQWVNELFQNTNSNVQFNLDDASILEP